MKTLHGTIRCELTGVGSKSEGVKSFLDEDSGLVLMLYREGVFPLDDKYFLELDGKTVSVTGEDEDEDPGVFRVLDVRVDTSDGIQEDSK